MCRNTSLRLLGSRDDYRTARYCPSWLSAFGLLTKFPLANLLQEPATCHYVLTVALPGLCQLSSFRQEAEPITEIVCQPLASPAPAEPSKDLSSQASQQQEEQSIPLSAQGDVVGASDFTTNNTEQVDKHISE